MKEKAEKYTPILASACVEVLTLHLLKQVSQGQLSAPKLYNTITRLRTAALVVESEQKIVDNRVRVYYTLTEKGEERLRQSAELIQFLAEFLKKE